MKKILPALLLAALLALASCEKSAQSSPETATPDETAAPAEETAAAETPAEETVTPSDASEDVYAWDFVGSYNDRTSERAHLAITPDALDGAYTAVLHWGDSAWSYAEWRMTASFDEASGKLTYTDGEMAHVSADENGTVTRETVWNDATGAFAFENGRLVWTDSREERCGEFDFERYTAPSPTAEDFADGYFRALAAAYQPGTAGASLKLAAASSEALRFAADHDLWTTDVSAMRGEMLAAWESLTDDERAAFDDAFLPVVHLLDDCLDDFEGEKATFEDAGVAEMTETLLADPAAVLSWRTLLSNTLTLGNSDGSEEGGNE